MLLVLREKVPSTSANMPVARFRTRSSSARPALVASTTTPRASAGSTRRTTSPASSRRSIARVALERSTRNMTATSLLAHGPWVTTTSRACAWPRSSTAEGPYTPARTSGVEATRRSSRHAVRTRSATARSVATGCTLEAYWL